MVESIAFLQCFLDFNMHTNYWNEDSDSENLERTWDYAFLGHSGARGTAILCTTLQVMRSYCSNNLLEEQDW